MDSPDLEPRLDVDELISPDQFFPKALGFEIALGAAAMVIGWIVGFDPLTTLRPNELAERSMSELLLWGVGGTVPLLFGLFFLDRYPFGPLKDLKQLTEHLVVPLFRQLPIWQLLLLSAAAGLGEEVLFRGLIQAGLADWINLSKDEWLACFIAAVLFGFCHWLSATYGVLAMIVGAYLGVLFVVSESLVPPMIAHGLYDFVALVYLVRSADEDGKIRGN